MESSARTWQQLFPLTTFEAGPLRDIERLLGTPSALATLASAERRGEHPESVVAEARSIGLAELFVGWGDPPSATFWHASGLCAIAAQASGSLAISLGINALALLPIYLAGTEEQRAFVATRLRQGASAAMLLSEWEAGSHLAAITTRADLGEDGRYAIHGEKQLINLVRRADLLMTLVRTRPAPTGGSLGATAGLSVVLVERDATVESLPRWETSPVPAADIGGVRFHGTRVDRDRVVGSEGDGFGLVQKALGISRAGIAAFATGTCNRALEIALRHGRERQLYGAPIVKLDAIADHLVKMAAWDLAATSLALKAVAAVNSNGLRAAHLTALAKLACCDLAERAVLEGRAVLGARAFLVALPFAQVARDVTLYGTFDGTRHVMLELLQWRLRQLARADEEASPDPGTPYQSPPVALTSLGRLRGRPIVTRPSAASRRLAEHDGAVELSHLHQVALSLEAVARALPSEAWDTQSVAFTLGECLAHVEAAVAVAELGDPRRRRALGARAADELTIGPLEELARYTIATICGRVLCDVTRVAHGAGVDVASAGLTMALAQTETDSGRRLRAAIRDQ